MKAKASLQLNSDLQAVIARQNSPELGAEVNRMILSHPDSPEADKAAARAAKPFPAKESFFAIFDALATNEAYSIKSAKQSLR